MRKIIVNAGGVSYYLVIVVVFIYGIVIAEYFSDINRRVLEIQAKELTENSFFNFFMSFSFVMMVLSAFIIWLVTSLLFHLMAILFDGKFRFKGFIKYSGLLYIFPAIGFLVAYLLSSNVQLPENNIQEFLKTDGTFQTMSWIINVSSLVYYILLIPVVRYLYRINWVKATGAIAAPILSIYLIGFGLAKFVF